MGGLATMHLRWLPLAIAGLALQVALFSPLGDVVPADIGRAAYVLATVVVALVVLVNRTVPGLPIVAVGAIANLVAIVANGGAMPADPGAVAAAGIRLDDPANSVVLADPALRPLTDI